MMVTLAPAPAKLVDAAAAAAAAVGLTKASRTSPWTAVAAAACCAALAWTWAWPAKYCDTRTERRSDSPPGPTETIRRTSLAATTACVRSGERVTAEYGWGALLGRVDTTGLLHVLPLDDAMV